VTTPAASEAGPGKHRTRILTAFAVFALALLVLWVGLPLLIPAFLFLTIVAIQEYAELLKLRGIVVHKRSLWVAAVLTVPASLPATYPGMQPLFAGVSWREALVAVLALYLVAVELAKPSQDSLYSVVFSLFGYVYIPWLFGFMITLRYTPDGVMGLWYLALPMLAMVASDFGAYAFGSAFGRRKLAPDISPNKSVEGSVGGVLLALAVTSVTALLARRFTGFEMGIEEIVLFSLLVSSAAQLGDLFESLLKRWAGVKDTGMVLPGHGGVLDRIDSALFTFPISYLFVTLIILR